MTLPTITGIKDIYAENPDWLVTDANTLTPDTKIDADVLIIGSGAGGGISAGILSQAGFKVVILEEGPLKTVSDFRMQENQAYHDLYQEAGARMTKDQTISLLQGRCVGGTTVINWTSAFRTPQKTLEYWASEFGVKGLDEAALAPWFEKIEEQLGISPWLLANANNNALQQGCEKLGIEAEPIPRNVKGCWNLGYCGMGCPTNAKQSMLITTIPDALNHGAQLIFNARAETLTSDGNKAAGAKVHATAASNTFTITARHTIVAAGAINGPGLLLRSQLPDPHTRIGKRTFIHPTPFSFAQFDETIAPYYGAPQSIYTDHFIWKQGVSGPMGYKLEVPPLHPGFTAALLCGDGQAHYEAMSQLPHLQSVLALLRDGFHPQSQGGNVELSDEGTPLLDYSITDYIWDGIKRAHRSMAEIQFAAGAKRVKLAHANASWQSSFADMLKEIEQLTYREYDVLIGSAHLMGGCGMGEDPTTSVVNSDCRYHHLDQLSVIDGSVFPTSIGTNPQLSIYALAAKQATKLAQQLRS
ncbi:putative GMC-type oxidoreductase [BD1-7 clade bacterium]|uniref:Putative GMC-type oxidoreductase n=1 Tax=BD1-7 clade bacterium TaxID=2029982 RepID=A0A5S9QYQ2_9GAMM|nr:putative GMC-type oxidoreductase [BD1-7 clade bacterium]